jgi:hypothetical protein
MSKRASNTIDDHSSKERKVDDGHPPPLPSDDVIVKRKDEWQTYADRIIEILQHDGYKKAKAKLDAELDEYAKEGKTKREQRWYDSEQWVFEEGEADGCDVNCIGDDCWWTGNSDRIKEYNGSYRMLGTSNLYLCEVCLHHRRDYFHYEDALYEDLDEEIGDDEDDE